MRLLFTILLLPCLLSQVLGQEKDYVPLERMSAYSWAGKGGIVSNNITSAIQAKSGYLWLTTYNGIIKFDGYQAKLYDKTNLDFLTIDGFRKGYESPTSNALYFASQGSGILKYDQKKFTPLLAKNDKMPQSISCMLIISDSLMYIGTNNQGLYKLENGILTKAGPSFFSESTILDILKEGDNLWVATEGDGLALIAPDGKSLNRFTIEDGLKTNNINTLVKFNKSLYLGTQAGISLIDKEGKVTHLAFMDRQQINAILPKGDIMWVGSDNGLGRFNPTNGLMEFISAHEASPLSRINELMFDKEGSLWISTGRDGLVQMRETGIINYTTFDGLTSNKINVITENYHQDAYFVGCDDGHLFRLKNGQLNEIEIGNLISPTGIRDVLEEPNGELWIASYRGLLHKKESDIKLFTLDDGLPALDLRRIVRDHQGNLWIGSRSGGLIKMVNGKVEAVYNKNNGLMSDFILSIEKDAQNNLVIGTHSGGLSIISPEGKISNYNITDNDSGIIIFNTHIDQAGRIWVICNMGIFMFQNKQFIPVQLSESYSGISNFDWLEDEAGNAWITTNRGLIHIKKEEIDQFLADPSYKMASRLINKSDGMVNEECTGAVRSLQSHTGELYIPTIGGVSVIAPDKMKVNTIVPEVYITSLAADTVVYNNSDVTIPPGKSRYILNFTALSFISPSEITFRYKLEGFDEDYLFASNERTVEYTNLPPGEYTFYVQASNNDGIWNEEGDVFTFTVDAFYYETAWFYLTLILVVALLLWGIYKWRIHGIQKMNEKLRKVNSELDSFVYSASHDLRSPLTSLLGLIDLTKKDKANAEIYLEKMRSSVKKLDAFISDIIDFSSNDRKEIESKEIDFEKITEQVVNELEYLNRDGKIEVTKKINTGSGFISDSRRIAIVLRNLVSNALKYKDPKKENPYVSIDISTSPAPHRVKIVVEDNGVGIEKSDQQDVFKMFYRANEYSSGSGIGLYIVKETVEKLNGTLELQSTPGEGTKFTITLPSH